MNKSSSSSVLEALESRLAPAGIVMLDVSGGVLTVTGDGDANNIQITETSPGSWNVSDGGGSGTLFSLNGGAALSSVDFAAANKINATLGGGDDTLSLAGTDVSGAVKVNGGDGADVFSTDGTTIGGNLVLTMGTGNDSVSLGAGSYKNINADLGTGDTDSFAIGGGVTDVTGNLRVQSAAANSIINLNDGSSATPQTLNVGGSLSILTGTGHDNVTLSHDTAVGGRVNLHLGSGNNFIDSPGNLSADSLSVKFGSGWDNAVFYGSSLNITNDAVFQKAVGGGSGISLGAESLAVGGDLVYRGSASTSFFTVAGQDATIDGAVRLTAIGGDSASFRISAENSTLGSVQMKSTAAETDLNFGDVGFTGSVHVLGSVSANMAGILNRFETTGTTVDGNLKVVSNAEYVDQFTFNESAVGGSTSLRAIGASETWVTLGSSTFDGAVVVNTGAGDDRVNSAGSVFNGAVNVRLGDGDDFFLSEQPGSEFQSLVINGGNGYDIANLLTGYGNTFVTPPVITNVEVVN